MGHTAPLVVPLAVSVTLPEQGKVSCLTPYLTTTDPAPQTLFVPGA